MCTLTVTDTKTVENSMHFRHFPHWQNIVPEEPPGAMSYNITQLIKIVSLCENRPVHNVLSCITRKSA